MLHTVDIDAARDRARIESLRSVQAILAGEPPPELVPGGDEISLARFRAFYEQSGKKLERIELGSLKWRFCRSLAGSTLPSADDILTFGRRNATINALIILSALLCTAQRSGSNGHIRVDDSLGILFALSDVQCSSERFKENLSSRSGFAVLSAPHFIDLCNGLDLHRPEDEHPSLTTEDIGMLLSRLQEYSSLKRFSSAIAMASGRIAFEETALDRLDALPPHLAFAYQRFIENIAVLAHHVARIDDQQLPIIEHWNENRGAIEIETCDGRLTDFLHSSRDASQILRMSDYEWWLEPTDFVVPRIVLPVRRTDLGYALDKTGFVIHSIALNIFPSIRTLAEKGSLNGRELDRLVFGLRTIRGLISRGPGGDTEGLLARLRMFAAEEGRVGDMGAVKELYNTAEAFGRFADIFDETGRANVASAAKEMAGWIMRELEPYPFDLKRIELRAIKLAADLGSRIGFRVENGANDQYDLTISSQGLVDLISDALGGPDVSKPSNPYLLPRGTVEMLWLATQNGSSVAVNRDSGVLKVHCSNPLNGFSSIPPPNQLYGTIGSIVGRVSMIKG